MLFAKSIFLILTIAILNLLSPIFLATNTSGREYQSFIDSQIICNLLASNYAMINASKKMGKYLSCLPSVEKSSIIKVSKPMKIKFRQSGGYAGLRLGCELDTNLLSVEESNRLRSLVDNSDMLKLKSNRTENSADLINYEIILEIDDVKHQLTFDDLTMSEKILPLLDYLQGQAKPLK